MFPLHMIVCLKETLKVEMLGGVRTASSFCLLLFFVLQMFPTRAGCAQSPPFLPRSENTHMGCFGWQWQASQITKEHMFPPTLCDIQPCRLFWYNLVIFLGIQYVTILLQWRCMELCLSCSTRFYKHDINVYF